jgi:hypothetical protein
MPVVDPTTGEIRQAQIFVGALGASHYLYTEATWTQALPDWIGAHVRMYTDFGGVPALTVPDNLKTGVTHACFYEPVLNPTYQDVAAHYGTAIPPDAGGAPAGQGSGFTLHPIALVWRTLMVAAAVPEAFAGVGVREGAGGRLEEQEAPAVGPPRLEYPFGGEAFRGGGVHPELGGDLRRRQPPGGPDLLGQAGNPVRLANGVNDGAVERLAGTRAEPAAIERGGDLAVGLLRGERADHLDDGRRRTPQIGGGERERALQAGRGPTLPANLEVDRAIAR